MKKILITLLVILVAGFLIYTNSFTDSCKKIATSDERNNCYQDTAIKNKNLKICEKITDSTKDSCIWNIARVKNDISICEKIPVLEDKEWCYHEIAQLNKNPAICDKITSQTAKDKCNDCLKGENSSCNIS